MAENDQPIETTEQDQSTATTQNNESELLQAALPQDATLAPPAQDTEANPTASQHENDIAVQEQHVNQQAPQVIAAPTQANTSVVVASPVQTEATSEQITADGSKEYPLEHEPTKISSVTVNGQVSTVGQGTAENMGGYNVVYDVEKNALVFANEIRGFIEVAYSHAPDVEQSLITKAVASLHDRLTRIESFVTRWEKANI
jgi:hypothetical protein